MKSISSWQPTRIVRNKKTELFCVDPSRIYAGSLHVAALQFAALLPLLTKYAHGKLLDAGCGNVPYFEVLKDVVDMHYCVDHPERKEAAVFADEFADFNQPFDLRSKDFDTIILLDVIAHVKDPAMLLIQLTNHLKPGGAIIITTPFVYWMSEYPHEYFHPTEFALADMLKKAGCSIEYLQPYGGYPDVLLDTINKGMTGRFSNRIFRLLASVVKKSSWYKNSNKKTMYSYPVGYSVVAHKL
jgi:SAM-dependent methyltransferase